MRKILGVMALAMGMMAAGGGVASAQDAGMAAMMAAQQSMQASQMASQQAIDQMNQATQQSIQNMQMALNTSSVGVYVPVRPPLPPTPRPMIVASGNGVGSLQVVIADSDSKALVFYTTNGTKPTVRSARYVGPIVVAGKMRVRAMALDLDGMPSGVVGKTFRVKG